MTISKIFSAYDSVDDILLALQENGLVLFADSKTGFTKFYQEKLIPVLPDEGIIQAYSNHHTEGYFYFLFDSEVYSYQQAIEAILKFRQ